MKGITITELQKNIASLDGRYKSTEECFYKLLEEVGELAESLRKKKFLEPGGKIKGTVDEELADVLYYVFVLANGVGVDLEKSLFLKDELRKEKQGRKNIFEE